MSRVAVAERWRLRAWRMKGEGASGGRRECSEGRQASVRGLRRCGVCGAVAESASDSTAGEREVVRNGFAVS
ncbi:hypothetical protein [Halococcus sp. PRR34]|uniref:hypothetical protein n=1 Tax=Halococcus sp. PRR34 TaxID=3020830 RepID=UPI00235F1C0F|nr:hypothetical protein [Halococcus sp. PRR34]